MNRTPHAEEQALLAACRQGRGPAWRVVHRAFAPDVGTFLLGMLPHRRNVDDLVQGTFLAFLHRLEDHPADLPLHTAVMRVARDIAVQEGPTHAARPGADLQSRVQGALATVEPVLREVWALRELAGCTMGETAEILDLPEETVIERHTQSHERLLVELRERPITSEQSPPSAGPVADCDPTLTWMASQGTGAALDLGQGRAALKHLRQCASCVALRRCHEDFGTQASAVLGFRTNATQENQLIVAGQLDREGATFARALPWLVVFAGLLGAVLLIL